MENGHDRSMRSARWLMTDDWAVVAGTGSYNGECPLSVLFCIITSNIALRFTALLPLIWFSNIVSM
jgi:hypothetical protein